MAEAARELGIVASTLHRGSTPHMPGKAGRAYRAAENLSLRDADTGQLTWEDFLTDHVN